MNPNCCFLSKTKLKVILWPSKDLLTNRLGTFCSVFSSDGWLLLWPEMLVPRSQGTTRGDLCAPRHRPWHAQTSQFWLMQHLERRAAAWGQQACDACYLSGSLLNDGGKDDIWQGEKLTTKTVIHSMIAHLFHPTSAAHLFVKFGKWVCVLCFLCVGYT